MLEGRQLLDAHTTVDFGKDFTISIKYASKDVVGIVEKVELTLQAGYLCAVKTKAMSPPDPCKRGQGFRW